MAEHDLQLRIGVDETIAREPQGRSKRRLAWQRTRATPLRCPSVVRRFSRPTTKSQPRAPMVTRCCVEWVVSCRAQSEGNSRWPSPPVSELALCSSCRFSACPSRTSVNPRCWPKPSICATRSGNSRALPPPATRRRSPARRNPAFWRLSAMKSARRSAGSSAWPSFWPIRNLPTSSATMSRRSAPPARPSPH